MNHDEDLLNKRDRESKLQAKQREDLRRSARVCRIKPGDVVIVERVSRSKGEARFGEKRYTVMEEEHGNLLLVYEEGGTLKRHVSQTKKVCEWVENRQNTPEDHEASEGKPSMAPVRPIRTKNAPSYLRDFIQMITDEVRKHYICMHNCMAINPLDSWNTGFFFNHHDFFLLLFFQRIQQ